MWCVAAGEAYRELLKLFETGLSSSFGNAYS
jgi:hypothetical protein